jgi:hypothetical protein
MLQRACMQAGSQAETGEQKKGQANEGRDQTLCARDLLYSVCMHRCRGSCVEYVAGRLLLRRSRCTERVDDRQIAGERVWGQAVTRLSDKNMHTQGYKRVVRMGTERTMAMLAPPLSTV